MSVYTVMTLNNSGIGASAPESRPSGDLLSEVGKPPMPRNYPQCRTCQRSSGWYGRTFCRRCKPSSGRPKQAPKAEDLTPAQIDASFQQWLVYFRVCRKAGIAA
jgi:hypothetical protein